MTCTWKYCLKSENEVSLQEDHRQYSWHRSKKRYCVCLKTKMLCICRFSPYRSVWLEFSRTVTSKAILNSNRSVFINMNFIFLLAACANILVDSFPFKCLSCLWLLIWSNRVWESWYLIIWLEITVLISAREIWTVTFSNWP